MENELALRSLLAAIENLREDGSPLVNNPAQDRETALVALRRWHSFPRRHKRKSATLDQRIEDLAKGLRDAFEPERHLVGPLMTDYRHLARVLAETLARSGATPSP